ncbi:MAG: hypothetical protein L0210_06590 [Rhodospirillales bacterium]|nr:hypothetical protein [Rhodospirillales bacterium]
MRPRPETMSKLQRLNRLVEPSDAQATSAIERAGETIPVTEASPSMTPTVDAPRADHAMTPIQDLASATPTATTSTSASAKDDTSVESVADADHRLPWNKPGLPKEKIVRLTVEFDYTTFLKLDWIVHSVPSMSKRKFIMGASKQAIENEVRRLRRKGIV